MGRTDVLKAIAVTAELCGRDMSENAARIFADDLAGYDPAQVLGALARCRREVKGALTPGDVISRLDDGRPGADEAWSMIPQDESATVVWTDEMRLAWGQCVWLLADGDRTAARMCFREAYAKAMQRARDAKTPVRWTVSLGTDAAQREGALLLAVERGQLRREDVAGLLPYEAPTADGLALLGHDTVKGMPS